MNSYMWQKVVDLLRTVGSRDHWDKWWWRRRQWAWWLWSSENILVKKRVSNQIKIGDSDDGNSKCTKLATVAALPACLFIFSIVFWIQEAFICNMAYLVPYFVAFTFWREAAHTFCSGSTGPAENEQVSANSFTTGGRERAYISKGCIVL